MLTTTSRDIAKGLAWILEHCEDDYGQVAGRVAAWGNGDIEVEARHVWRGGPPRED